MTEVDAVIAADVSVGVPRHGYWLTSIRKFTLAVSASIGKRELWVALVRSGSTHDV